ncbi:hypothetical protein C4K04_1592 [Pseudomonas chlororaphis]|uniref:Uncharacterized protein n=1 Tax=Pseudomonas chlororaphis TaxID=587753 RepID=A0A3G7TLP4_9PSED|nr:hypothetical protein C4K04_1592 [Pseudomonas chlororaphis]
MKPSTIQGSNHVTHFLMTDIKHEVDEGEQPYAYELLSTLKPICLHGIIHACSRLILVEPSTQASRKRPQVWLETKLSEMLERERARKSPNAISGCSSMEKLVVLTQDRNDASTMLWDVIEGVVLVLEYGRTLQNFRFRRASINHA